MVFDGLLVVAKEVVCVAKVTNCPALCLLISKFTDQFQVCPEREREREMRVPCSKQRFYRHGTSLE